jgi:hypothetical protein
MGASTSFYKGQADSGGPWHADSVRQIQKRHASNFEQRQWPTERVIAVVKLLSA